MTESMSFALPITALSAGHDALALAWNAFSAVSGLARLAWASAILRRKWRR